MTLAVDSMLVVMPTPMDTAAIVRMDLDAFAGEPLAKGGCGSYSMQSWTVCPTVSP
jgi:hypothetical protein